MASDSTDDHSTTHTSAAARLDSRMLPRDWYERYGARMLQNTINEGRRDWTDWHKSLGVCRRTYNPYDGTTLTASVLPDELSLFEAQHFANKTAVIYLVDGVDFDLDRAANRSTWPNGSSTWLQTAYDTWARECSSPERLDARFALAPQAILRDHETDLKEAVGLGQAPKGDLRRVVHRLVSFHLRHCDLVHNRAMQALTADEKKTIELSSPWHGIANTAIAYYSSLFPTSRAVLLIGRNPMPEPMNVLLVLTGHYQDMKSGRPTFTIIPRDEIVNTRAKNIIEVHLSTAIRFLRALERREEAANEAFRARNDQRRQAIELSIRQRAFEEMTELLEKSAREGPDVDLQYYFGRTTRAWSNIVEDERLFELLEDTAALRQIDSPNELEDARRRDRRSRRTNVASAR